MSITFNPIPSLNLKKPTRVKVHIPLDLLVHFNPAVDLSAGNVHHLMHKTEPIVRVVAGKLSMALFGSTDSLSDPFVHWLRSYRDRPVESVSFSLSHKIAHDGLNPIYLTVMAKLLDREVVFGVEEVMGEQRQTLNYRHEVEEADLRKSMMQAAGEQEWRGGLVRVSLLHCAQKFDSFLF
ncbi:hypothetical protein VTI74DRAFT_2232 [Chaetomium olivicolor]